MDDLISRQEAIDAVENIDCSDGVGISALKCEAVDDGVTAIKALPSAQPEKVDTPTVDTPNCDDTISRQAAIDTLDKHLRMTDVPVSYPGIISALTEWLNDLPSAQPEKHTQERTETHTCDYINRKDAIDAHYEYCNKHPDAGFPVWSLKILEDLPSAQPDLSGYSDKLWKAAYERGKAEAQPDLDEVYAHAETEAEARFHAERKKGKWIYGESEAGNDGYYCSKCGNFVPWKYDEYDIDFIKEFLFCNKCGAEMEGQDE